MHVWKRRRLSPTGEGRSALMSRRSQNIIATKPFTYPSGKVPPVFFQILMRNHVPLWTNVSSTNVDAIANTPGTPHMLPWSKWMCPQLPDITVLSMARFSGDAKCWFFVSWGKQTNMIIPRGEFSLESQTGNSQAPERDLTNENRHGTRRISFSSQYFLCP